MLGASVLLGAVAPVATLAWPGPNARPIYFVATTVFGFLAFSAVGALILSRRPNNAIGWLFAVFGLLMTSVEAANTLSARAAAEGPTEFLPILGQWWSGIAGGPTPIITLALLLLLFPTGSPSSSRWRVVAIVAAVSGGLALGLQAIAPGRMDAPEVQIVNPVGIDALQPFAEPAVSIAYVVLLLCLPLGAISLALRFRRADVTQRRQIKWFMLSGALVAATFIAAPFFFWKETTPAWMWQVAFGVDIVSIPLACGIAILRHRLYDIDRIVSRTVTYAIVTAMLAGTFAIVVVVPAAILGTEKQPEWLIAVATLVVAALFRPVPARPERRRPSVQSGPLRRGTHDRGIHRAPTRAGGHRRARGAAHHGRERDDASGLRAAVASGPSGQSFRPSR